MTQQPTPQGITPRPRLALLAGAASMATVAVLIVLKAAAYAVSTSPSVLASLIDSLTDASVSVITYCTIHYSLRPADSNHRYGHGKAEGLAALIQAAFICGAGAFLLLESLSHFIHPPPRTLPLHSGDLSAVLPVIKVMIAAIVLSGVLILIQKYTLLRAPSLAVEADKAHYAGDIGINLGVIAVIFAVSRGCPEWVDPLFAVAVALWLGINARGVAGKGIDMLLDRELPETVRATIATKVLAQKSVLGMHDLRTTKSGMKILISFDIEVDPVLSLHDAHEITRTVEQALLADFPLSEIMIHVDPFGDTHDSRHQVAGVHH